MLLIVASDSFFSKIIQTIELYKSDFNDQNTVAWVGFDIEKYEPFVGIVPPEVDLNTIKVSEFQGVKFFTSINHFHELNGLILFDWDKKYYFKIIECVYNANLIIYFKS